MNCPNCDKPNYSPNQPCPDCQFRGDPTFIEELLHIDWLLDELETWADFNLGTIEQKYSHRQQELEVTLKLRLPLFSEAEAHDAWPKLFQRELLLQKLTEWQQVNLIAPSAIELLLKRTQEQITELAERLSDQARPPTPDPESPEMLNFLQEAVTYLHKNHCFTSVAAKGQVSASLLTKENQQKIAHEIKLQEAKKIEPSTASTPPPIPETPKPTPSPTPRPPKIPLHERLWRTMLSERTLQAMLFLGIFLLFSAAISFVVWGWKDFSPPLRVAIPTGFTAIFFALGWVVRTKTPLYRSGIALSAIASLLIPIDFYTVYINFHVPLDYRPGFWFITSIACLLAYIFITLNIQSRFFGYLVATAAGSTVLAIIEIGNQLLGLSLDWRTAALSVLSLWLIIIATTLSNLPKSSQWRVLAEPLRYIALLTVGILMPLTFGWRFINRATFDTLHYAVTINWWFGGFIFAWAAIYHRSHILGILAAIALPVALYLGQSAIFFHGQITPSWHAFGWAWLVPLYFIVGYRLSTLSQIGGGQGGGLPHLHGHARTAINGGSILLVVATIWPLINFSQAQLAIASSHTVLMGAVMLAALLWQRPLYLYGASLLSLSAITFTMLKFDLTFAQLSVGWASLAIAHVILALNVGIPFPIPSPNFAAPLVDVGYALAALSLLPPFLSYNGTLLTYTLSNWLALTTWGARLAHLRQPGFINFRPKIPFWTKPKPSPSNNTFHWLTALFLPIWWWVLFNHWKLPDFTLVIGLTALAWGMILLSYRLTRLDAAYRLPWHLMGGFVSVIVLLVASTFTPDGFTPAISILAIGLLYFTDAFNQHKSRELIPAGLVTAWGYLTLLNQLHVSFDAATFALSLLIALFILGGLWAKTRHALFTAQPSFLNPLYFTAHLLMLFTLIRIYIHPLNHILINSPWTDRMRDWGAMTQLLLSVVYLIYAWHASKARWTHLATWLITASGGFIAITYSSGRGSSAAGAALLAMAFVLIERFLEAEFSILGLTFPNLKSTIETQKSKIKQLYQWPLLTTGWTVSAIAILLSLIRNLLLLGGGRPQQIWAAIGLLIVTALYALSAKLFRRPFFVWLAAVLIFAPWTILTNLNWFTTYSFTLPQFAISWLILAWLLFLISLVVERLAPPPYLRPLKSVIHLLIPFSLLWAMTDIDTSCLTIGLAIALYGTTAWLDYRRFAPSSEKIKTGSKFLYPTLGLMPIWAVYLFTWQFSHARAEHYGLLLLIFAPLGLAIGQWLQRRVRGLVFSDEISYALPAYLMGYGTAIIGTMLVAQVLPILALTLLFDAILLIISTWLFKKPIFLCIAVVLVPYSLTLSLHETNIAGNRYGWWLIALAADYLALTWTLRRAKLTPYGSVTLIAALILIALGLPPSSVDQTGALWGYGSAALLYGITAFWLKQPLLLTPACALAIVPYAITLQKSALHPNYYGLALLPGAIAALAAAFWLERKNKEITSPLTSYSLPFYVLGFGLIIVAPFFTHTAGLTALSFLFQMPIFGWAIYHFRQQIWLLATALAGHLTVIYFFEYFGWWDNTYAWLYFLPVTLLTTLIAVLIEKLLHETPPPKWSLPHGKESLFNGWSWSGVLYALALFDLTITQCFGLLDGRPSTGVTFVHALLIAALASLWLSPRLTYLSLTLGAVVPIQWLMFHGSSMLQLPVTLAQLALGYGMFGYGLTILSDNLNRSTNSDAPKKLPAWLAMWKHPLQQFSLGLSFLILITLIPFFLPLITIASTPETWVIIEVLIWLGLLYLIVAASRRSYRLGYTAVGMLLAAWLLFLFRIVKLSDPTYLQWYIVPIGVYILAISYLEWQHGYKNLARGLDYAAVFLMMGTLFQQTLQFGWHHALLLGSEGLVAFWWGSARRLRRFLYAGMVGVILATLGQLINSLWSVNQWMVFGLIGLALVITAIIVERKLEDIKTLREVFETWE